MQSEASLPSGDRLDEGLRAIQQAANQLMHEIAGEVWRAAGGDKDQTGSKILESLSRDQGIRGLITHSDERFQALAVRTARLEDTMNALAESIRQVSEQIAVAFQTLTERDRAIIETVQGQIRGHGELITQETGRIAQAMQAYVQEGVAAMGQLAGSVQGKMQVMGTRDEDISAQMRDLGEQVQLVHERVSIDTRELASALQTRVLGLARLMRSDSEKLHGALDTRIAGLAKLVRSDNETLAEQIVADQEASKQALRAMKELQASLPVEVIDSVERRMEALAESVQKSNEMLAQRIDRMAEKIGERQDNDIQIVIDRMGDAMHALASLGRAGAQASASTPANRIELD